MTDHITGLEESLRGGSFPYEAGETVGFWMDEKSGIQEGLIISIDHQNDRIKLETSFGPIAVRKQNILGLIRSGDSVVPKKVTEALGSAARNLAGLKDSPPAKIVTLDEMRDQRLHRLHNILAAHGLLWQIEEGGASISYNGRKAFAPTLIGAYLIWCSDRNVPHDLPILPGDFVIAPDLVTGMENVPREVVAVTDDRLHLAVGEYDTIGSYRVSPRAAKLVHCDQGDPEQVPASPPIRNGGYFGTEKERENLARIEAAHRKSGGVDCRNMQEAPPPPRKVPAPTREFPGLVAYQVESAEESGRLRALEAKGPCAVLDELCAIYRIQIEGPNEKGEYAAVPAEDGWEIRIDPIPVWAVYQVLTEHSQGSLALRRALRFIGGKASSLANGRVDPGLLAWRIHRDPEILDTSKEIGLIHWRAPDKGVTGMKHAILSLNHYIIETIPSGSEMLEAKILFRPLPSPTPVSSREAKINVYTTSTMQALERKGITWMPPVPVGYDAWTLIPRPTDSTARMIAEWNYGTRTWMVHVANPWESLFGGTVLIAIKIP